MTVAIKQQLGAFCRGTRLGLGVGKGHKDVRNVSYKPRIFSGNSFGANFQARRPIWGLIIIRRFPAAVWNDAFVGRGAGVRGKMDRNHDADNSKCGVVLWNRIGECQTLVYCLATLGVVLKMGRPAAMKRVIISTRSLSSEWLAVSFPVGILVMVVVLLSNQKIMSRR